MVNLFVLQMFSASLLRFSTVSPHERQARHFHKALGFPLTSCRQNIFLNALGAHGLLARAICSAIQPLLRDQEGRKSFF